MPFTPSEEPEQPEATGSSPAAPLEPVFLHGERTLRVEGAPFEHGDFAFEVAFLEDVDGDGDRDVLAVGESEGLVALVFARREGDRFTPRVLGSLQLPELQLRETHGAGADGLGHRTLSWIAETNGGPCGVHFAVEAGETPRLRETLGVVDGRAELNHEDVDEDGHVDLVARVRSAGASVRLEWLDRPGGLALNDADLERALAEATPNQRVGIATAWCGENARVAIAGHFGVDCDASARRYAAIGSALSKDTLLEQLQALDPLRADDEVFEAARRSLCRPNIEYQRVAPPFDAGENALRYGALVFEDGRLFDAIRRRYWPHDEALAEGAEAPVPYPAPEPGRLVRAEGEGPSARLITTLVGAESIPLGAPARAWVVLGWAPQGMVLFDGAERRLLPFSAAGPGAMRDLTGLPPAPLRGARSSEDGALWAAETPYGIVRNGDELWCGEHPVLALAIDGEQMAVADADGVHILRQGNGQAR